jgi:hypothetical protein
LEQETELLRWHKGRHLGKAGGSVRLEAWDRLFYTALARVRVQIWQLLALSSITN